MKLCVYMKRLCGQMAGGEVAGPEVIVCIHTCKHIYRHTRIVYRYVHAYTLMQFYVYEAALRSDGMWRGDRFRSGDCMYTHV